MFNLKRMTAVVVTGSLFWNSSYSAVMPTQATQAPVTFSAEDILNSSSDLRSEITRGLQDEKILLELAKLGVEKTEVEARLAAMSDQEIYQIQNGIQRQAGGDVIIISVTTALIILILVLLLVR